MSFSGKNFEPNHGLNRGWFKSELCGRLASKNTFFESLGKQFEWGRGIIVTKG